MKQFLLAAIFALGITVPLCGQTRLRRELHRHREPPSAPTVTPALYSPSPRGLYRPHMTWYQFMLHQLNPHDRDYGAWLRERRKALVDASIRNHYFWYSFWATVAIIVLVAGLLKSLYDRRKEKWIMGEMMDEVRAHDACSRRVAHEAISRYNEHIEMCNRAMEAQQTSLAAGSQPDQAQNRLDKVQGELVDLRRDNSRMAEEIQQRQAAIAELSKRIDALSKKTAGHGNGQDGHQPLAVSDPEALRVINDLQQQLHYERVQNRRLQGGS
jgi:hypothetical protein